MHSPPMAFRSRVTHLERALLDDRSAATLRLSGRQYESGIKICACILINADELGDVRRMSFLKIVCIPAFLGLLSIGMVIANLS